jgi:DNA-directed RNA polymerase specialized sigma24 family protein
MDTSSPSPLRRSDGVGGPADADAGADATSGVTALYQAHAVGLIRLAIVMLGDRAAAEDVVQDAFFGLYRNWSGLVDPGKALSYARPAV